MSLHQRVKDDYGYTPAITDELDRIVEDLFPRRTTIARAPVADDVGGVDVHYRVTDTQCPLQIRCRFDAPPYAPDEDVTFRTTEPPMIAAGTYAPLALFAWFKGTRVVAAKVIDVYRMARDIHPALADRSVIRCRNGRGAFHAVRVAELHDAGALLRQRDARYWVTVIFGGDDRLTAIAAAYQHQGRLAL